MKNSITLGHKIKYFRERANMSQLELEVAVDASNGSISRMENGHVNPTKETLSKIIDAVKLSPIEITDLLDLQQITSLLEVNDTLIGQTNLSKVMDIILNELGHNLGYKFPAIFLIDDEGKKLLTKKFAVKPLFVDMVKRLFGKKPEDISFSLDQKDNILIKAIKSKEILKTNNLLDFVFPYLNQVQATVLQATLNTNLMIAAPIIVKGKVIGILGASLKKDTLTDTEAMVIKAFTNQIAQVIHNLQEIALLKNEIRQLKKTHGAN